MKQKKLTFPNEQGVKLSALLDLPEDENPIAYVLFAHCFTCTKNLNSAARIARALTLRRFAVLRFDFTGIGQSGGDFAEATFSSDVSDLAAAARFLEKEYAAPHVLIGHSLGGTAALLAAREIPSVIAVATIAAPCSPQHILEIFDESTLQKIEQDGEAEVKLAGRSFIITRKFLEDLEKHDIRARLGKLDAALMIMHSPRDSIVSIDNAATIYKAAKHPKNFVSLDPADHLLTRENDACYAGDMVATWARRYLDICNAGEARQEVIDNRVTARTGHEGFYTEMFANGYPLVADEPASYGGTGQGPSPYDYLQAALGACTTMTVQMYARRKKWPLKTAVVRLSHKKIHAEDCEHCEEKGTKIDRFERELELQGDLSKEQRRRLLEIAEKCPVHRTLHAEVLVETSLREE